MRGERRDVAVVEVQPERLGVELVGEALAGLDQAAAAVLADPRHPVHERRVDAVEVDRVRVRGAVGEADPQRSPSRAAQGRPGDAAVVGPGGVHDARARPRSPCRRRRAPTRAAPARSASRWSLPVVEVAQDLGRVEAVGAWSTSRPATKPACAVAAAAEWRRLGRARRRGRSPRWPPPTRVVEALVGDGSCSSGSAAAAAATPPASSLRRLIAARMSLASAPGVWLRPTIREFDTSKY